MKIRELPNECYNDHVIVAWVALAVDAMWSEKS